MLRVVVGKYGGSQTLYVNGSWYVGISFVISDAGGWIMQRKTVEINNR